MIARIPFTSCPLCAATTLKDVGSADCTRHPLYKPELPPTIAWRQCLACEHVFTDGYFDGTATALIFSGTHTHQQVGHDAERQRMVSARMVEKVLLHAKSGPWLDVGFGNGSLLFTAQEYGFDPVGVDLRAENVAVMNKLGIPAHCADLASLKLERPCAVVSLADVLEHMPFPKTGLAAAHRLLGEGGIAFISMPNRAAMLWRILDAQQANPFWGELEHYHNFTRERLYALLRETGFEPVSYGVSERYRACMEVVARKA
ncbi:MAG: class I SAM-dependent methyltransferase [Rhodospirillaceae bacterium]|nr:class I SAM-dependent methyltransferase [Rhodospirillaceae bacterium]